MITINEIVDELLSFDKKEEPVKPSFFERVHNFVKRQEIDKALQDEIKNDNDRIMKLGHDAEAFLNSKWYAELIEPQLRQAIKGSLQAIIREGQDMTEVQLKNQIANIKTSLSLLASLRLKIIRAKEIKGA